MNHDPHTEHGPAPRTPSPARALLGWLFHIGLQAVEPGMLVEKAFRDMDLDVPGTVLLVGGGKAARPMAEATLRELAHTKRGIRVRGTLAVPGDTGRADEPRALSAPIRDRLHAEVRLVPAEHPLPGEGSLRAAQEVLRALRSADEQELILVLLSGGGSSLLSAPVPEVGSVHKAQTVELLLGAGADIVGLNTVRRHLSLIKGGMAARAAMPTRVVALLLSDVPGDDPAVIASGPFAPDPSTFADALDVLDGFELRNGVPVTVARHLEAGAAGRVKETPKPGDPAFARVQNRLIGTNRTAQHAIASAALEWGFAVEIWPEALYGEARTAGRNLARRLRSLARETSTHRPVVVVAGGETTVTVTGGGRGGRNQEVALGAAMELDGAGDITLLAAGTDGIDGPTDAAGASADGNTVGRGRALGLSAQESLGKNDAYTYFAALGDLVKTGPTGTNVADVALGLIHPPSAPPIAAGPK